MTGVKPWHSETEMSVWPDFLSLEILQTMNFLNICFSQHELLFLTYKSSSLVPWDITFDR